MRSFQQVIVLLFALFAFAFAAESEYDATVYITSTVYRVNTITLSGSSTASLANSTSTIAASVPSIPSIPSVSSVPSLRPSFSGNGTTAVPTSVSPTSEPFQGAASHLNVNAFVAAIAVGVGYLAL